MDKTELEKEQILSHWKLFRSINTAFKNGEIGRVRYMREWAYLQRLCGADCGAS